MSACLSCNFVKKHKYFDFLPYSITRKILIPTWIPKKNSSSSQCVSHSCHALSWKRPHQSHDESLQTIASRKDDILITFAVTGERLGFISSDFHHDNNIRLVTIRNAIPSGLGRGSEYLSFFEAVMTKIEAPFEQILDQLQLPVTAIITDAILLGIIRCGSSTNIPVATLD